MSSNKFSVIVVEDEALIARNIIKNIERASQAFSVVATAEDGEKALELIEAYMPDVVITDIKMPVMDGIELIKNLSHQYPQIKTVILSGYGEFEYAKSAITYNASGYLLKPINLEELKKVLNALQQDLNADRGKLSGFADMQARSIEEIVDSVKEYIDKNYNQNIDFTLIARNLGFSLAYLSKSFSKITGQAPTRYLIGTRMREAKKLLKSTNLSIAQISDAIGYVDQFSFSKSFKNETGLSPIKFRSQG